MINATSCQIRAVSYLQSSLLCGRCQQPAPRFSTADRVAVDLDLDQPLLLLVTVSVHFCAACRHYFRAQPPFLRPDGVYTNRVIATAVAAVYEDGMAMRRVPARIARDFWVQPCEGSIRQWCRAYRRRFDFATDYQPWVVQSFSGILCVDEVYQGQLALLLAVDPAASDGDRLIGYQLVHGSVDSTAVEQFLVQLKGAGITPDEVITDGSALYPSVLAKIWPLAAHQLCLFHETRRVTRAAMEVIQALRRSLPQAPAKVGHLWGRPFNAAPPTDNPDAPDYQRWQFRQATRQAGIAEVHRLTREGLSQRAIARQVGLHRKTVQTWLTLEPPAEVPDDLAQSWRERHLPNKRTVRRTTRQQKREPARLLKEHGLSYSAIAAQVGVHRVTVSAWLNETPASPPEQPDQVDPPLSPAQPASPATPEEPAPPAPWETWERVSEVREALREHRFLLVRQPAHLSAEQQAHVDKLLSSPAGAELQVARRFVTDWYLLWHDKEGRRRTLEEARTRFADWSTDAAFAAVAPFKRVQVKMAAQFERVSAFLRQQEWEATNNGAERFGRAFRHQQAPHFNLRETESIEGALAVMAGQRKAAALEQAPRDIARSGRGRKTKASQQAAA